MGSLGDRIAVSLLFLNLGRMGNCCRALAVNGRFLGAGPDDGC